MELLKRLNKRNATLLVVLALGVQGCSNFFLPTLPPASRPVARVADDERPAITPGARKFAEEMYRSGSTADDSALGRAAFRQVCAEHESERDIVIEALYHHAQEYVAMRRAWYHEHCSGDGYAIVDPDTAELHAGVVCEPAAGPPPTRLYPRSHEEILAQRQREACRAAQ